MPLETCFIYAFIAAAGVLTHLVPVVGSLYALVPVVAYWGISGSFGSWEEVKTAIRNLAGIGLIGMILVTPYLANLSSTQVSPAEVQWVQEFQRHGSGGAWEGTVRNALSTIPRYLREKIYGKPFLTLGFVGIIVLAFRKPQLAAVSFIFSLTVIGLVIDSMYWILPLSYALYPERTALLLLLPFSLGIASLIDGIRRLIPKEFLPWALAIYVFFLAMHYNQKYVYKGLIQWSPVTEADMKAMEWIQKNTDPNDVFYNRYGDAGLWIPAIAFRPITDPHLNPFYFDEFREGSRGLKAKYVYVGKRKVYGEPFSRDQFESRRDTYRKVYDSDGVTIYQVIMPTSLDAPHVAVRLHPPPSYDFERVLAKHLKAIDHPPQLTIATDRPRYRRADVLNVTVDLVNSDRSRPVDAYLALAWPDGSLSFWDGNGFSLYTRGPWVPLARGIGLAKGVRVTNYPLLSLKRIDMPSGSYTCYLVLTEPNTYNVITKAQATFTLEP